MNRADLREGMEVWVWSPEFDKAPFQDVVLEIQCPEESGFIGLKGVAWRSPDSIYPDPASLNASISAHADAERERILALRVDDFHWVGEGAGECNAIRFGLVLVKVHVTGDGWRVHWYADGFADDSMHPTLEEAKQAVEQAVNPDRLTGEGGER